MARKSRVQVLLERFVEDQILIPSGLYIRLSDEDEEDIETNSIGNQEKLDGTIWSNTRISLL